MISHKEGYLVGVYLDPFGLALIRQIVLHEQVIGPAQPHYNLALFWRYAERQPEYLTAPLSLDVYLVGIRPEFYIAKEVALEDVQFYYLKV